MRLRVASFKARVVCTNSFYQCDINDIVQVVQQQIDLAKLPADQRSYVRVKIEPELLAQMKQQPNVPMDRWAPAVYEASHKPIANGTPPLTRQGTDAFLESLFFMVGEVSGRPAPTLRRRSCQ